MSVSDSTDSLPTCDLLFVLAGAKIRKLHGWSEFQRGAAPRLMLSTSRFELRKFADLPVTPKPDLIAMAAAIPPPQRHCFVLFESSNAQVIWVRRKRLGTMMEIEFLGKWLRENPAIRSVRVISSDYHLRRIQLCCRLLVPRRLQVAFAGVQGESAGWRTVVSERMKLALYVAVLAIKSLVTAGEQRHGLALI